MAKTRLANLPLTINTLQMFPAIKMDYHKIILNKRSHSRLYLYNVPFNIHYVWAISIPSGFCKL